MRVALTLGLCSATLHLGVSRSQGLAYTFPITGLPFTRLETQNGGTQSSPEKVTRPGSSVLK